MTAEEYKNLPRGVKKSKYGNQRTVVDGVKFDSKKEARIWSELRLLERAGHIKDLERQVNYPLIVNGVKVCSYIADFVFTERSIDHDAKGAEMFTWDVVVSDAKGLRTKEYRLKKKLMWACHGIVIREY